MPVLFFLCFTAGQIATLITGSGKWSFLDLFAAAASLVFGVRLIIRRKPLPALFVPALLFAGVLSAEALVRRGTVMTEWLYAGRWLAYAGIYGLVVSERHPGVWKLVLYASGVTLAVLGFLQLIFYPDLRNLMYLGWDPHYRRVFATLFDPNFSGIINALTFIAGLSVWNDFKKKRLFIAVAQAITAAALFLSYSRSSILAGIVSAGLWCVVRRRFKWLFIGTACCVAALFFLSGKGEGQNFLRRVSSEARIGSVHAGIASVAASPIIGTGFTAQQTGRPVGAPPVRAGSVDASFLYVLAAGGIVACAAYLYLGVRVWRIAQSKGPKNDTLMLSLVAVLVHSLFINSLFYPWVMAWMWILVGNTERITADTSRAS